MWVANDGSVLSESIAPNNDQSVRTGGGQVTPGTWTHIAAVFDRTAGEARIYINGSLAKTQSISTASAPVTDGPLLIGATTEASPDLGRVEGVIDEVQVWSRARSGAEIAATMNQAADVSDAALKLYLPFNETAGVTEANAGSAGRVATWRSLNPDGITGRIATPGATQTYTFTLAADTQLYIDSLTSNDRLCHTLSDVHGVLVSRTLRYADGNDTGDNLVLNLAAGTYSLVVSGSGDATGAFNLRFLDLAQAAPVTLGDKVTGTLEPASETRAFRFAANAGDKLFFDTNGAAGEFYWRLIDPFGRQVIGPSGFNDQADIALPYAGAWTILVEGKTYEGGRATFAFTPVRESISTTALTVGTRIDAALTTPGETDRYTFTLAQATSLLFDSFTNDGRINWTLQDKFGATVVGSTAFSGSDLFQLGRNPLMKLAAGDYTLIVRANGDTTAPYAFRLLDLSGGTTIVTDAAAGATLGQVGQATDIYHFQAGAFDRLQFHSISQGSGSLSWRLLDPFGNQVARPPQAGPTAAS